MPISITVCLCILICSLSFLALMIAMFFVEETLWDNELRHDRIEHNIRNKKNPPAQNEQAEDPRKISHQ